MIDGIGKPGAGRIDLMRAGVERGTAALSAGAVSTDPAVNVGGAATELLTAGAPVDSTKVAAIRSAIAAGRYPVDPARIADAMLAADLPEPA